LVFQQVIHFSFLIIINHKAFSMYFQRNILCITLNNMWPKNNKAYINTESSSKEKKLKSCPGMCRNYVDRGTILCTYSWIHKLDVRLHWNWWSKLPSLSYIFIRSCWNFLSRTWTSSFPFERTRSISTRRSNETLMLYH